jgi:hypothetical protein
MFYLWNNFFNFFLENTNQTEIAIEFDFYEF